MPQLPDDALSHHVPGKSLLVNWSDIYAFMIERDPELGASVVGAKRDDIETCQRELGVSLPNAYVDFLVTMGVETGPYWPLGRGVDTNFYRLLRRNTAEDYDPREYFLIGEETDASRCPIFDIYLDLRHSTAEGTALIEAENGSDWGPPEPMRMTLLERLTESAWQTFEIPRHTSSRTIHIHVDPPDGGDSVRARVLDLLGRQGHSASLPTQRRLDCLGSTSEASFVHVKDHLRMIRAVIAGSDDKRLAHLVELFLDNIPNASSDHQTTSHSIL